MALQHSPTEGVCHVDVNDYESRHTVSGRGYELGGGVDAEGRVRGFRVHDDRVDGTAPHLVAYRPHSFVRQRPGAVPSEPVPGTGVW